MRDKTLTSGYLTLILALSAAVPAQTREKKPTERDFPTLVTAADKAFAAKKYATALERLQAALRVTMLALQKQVIAAMPPAPTGFKAEPQRTDPANEPYAMALLGSVGAPIEHTYKGAKGAEIKISCVIDSPLAQMLAMAFAVAGANPDMEVIGYGTDKGLLKKQDGGKHLELQVLIANKHLVTVEARGITEEQLFALIDKAFVTRLAALLAA